MRRAPACHAYRQAKRLAFLFYIRTFKNIQLEKKPTVSPFVDRILCFILDFIFCKDSL
jgi:hypothetical protein